MDVAKRVMDLADWYALLGAGDSGFNGLQLLMLAGGVLGLGVVMRSTYRRVGRSRSGPRTSVRSTYAELTGKTDPRPDVEQVMLELDHLARQIHGRIDTRFAKLETVIRDADERIDTLSRLLREAKGEPAVDVTLGEEATDDPPHTASRPTKVPTSNATDMDSQQAVIYRLADSGLSAGQIAENVARNTGEVELILALRRTRRDAARPAELIRSSPPKSAS